MLEIRELDFSRGDKCLFQNFSKNFETGMIYSITGKNGSGKSTLLNLLSGYEIPNSGKITLRKNKFDYIIVKQKAYLYEEQSVKVNMQYYKGFFKSSSEHINKIFKTFKINELLNLKVSKLSDGQKKRVNIAKSFLNEKGKVILLDEPFTMLDDEFCERLKKYLIEIKKDKIIIISTNNIEKFADITNEKIILGDKNEILF